MVRGAHDCFGLPTSLNEGGNWLAFAFWSPPEPLRQAETSAVSRVERSSLMIAQHTTAARISTIATAHMATGSPTALIPMDTTSPAKRLRVLAARFTVEALAYSLSGRVNSPGLAISGR
jgi:hypothetical protein